MNERKVRVATSWHIAGLIVFLLIVLAMLVQRVRQDEAAIASAFRRAESWREVLDHSPLAVVVSDDEGRIQLWNTAATRLLGWSEEEAVGAYVSLIITEGERADHAEAMRNADLLAKLRRGEVLLHGGCVLCKDGRVIPVQILLAGVVNGEVLYAAQIIPLDQRLSMPGSCEREPYQADVPHLDDFKPGDQEPRNEPADG